MFSFLNQDRVIYYIKQLSSLTIWKEYNWYKDDGWHQCGELFDLNNDTSYVTITDNVP